VYITLKEHLDVSDAPRNSTVVANRKAADVRRTRESKGETHRQTFADEFQAIFSMVQSDKVMPDAFVRCVIATGLSVPSVILYTRTDS